MFYNIIDTLFHYFNVSSIIKSLVNNILNAYRKLYQYMNIICDSSGVEMYNACFHPCFSVGHSPGIEMIISSLILAKSNIACQRQVVR